MATPLGLGILGLLARGPLTGYELSRSLKGAIRYFWQVRHSQVYPELARLEEEGLVTFIRIPQQGKPDQKRFSLTSSGRKALKTWLTSPLGTTPTRSEITLRAFCVSQAEASGAKAWYQEEARKHRARLETYEGFRLELERTAKASWRDPRSAAFADYAVLMRGIAIEGAAAEWCCWMSDQLDAPAHAAHRTGDEDKPSRNPEPSGRSRGR